MSRYFCEQCNSLQDATRSIELSQLPPVLHVSLLRFVFDPATMERKKSKHVVSFPPTIDMAPFLGRQDAPAPSVPSPQQIYQLRGVLLHKGASAYHGHYQAEIHDDSSVTFFFHGTASHVCSRVKKWFSFNDEIVTEMKTPFVTKKGATSA
jgi:ubiquitin C-terminal hydrolase